MRRRFHEITGNPAAPGRLCHGESTAHPEPKEGSAVPETAISESRPFPPVEGVRHRFVQARGIRFHVAEAGTGEPVMLLHGFPQHWYAWRHVIPQLAGDYRLICPDLRGFGWSDTPARGYDTAGRAADVIAIMDALGLERVWLVGHGWGAWAGFFVCLQAPRRVRGYLALNMVHPWPTHRAALTGAWRQWHTALWEYPLVGRQVLRRCPGLTRYLLRHWVSDPGTLEETALDEFVESSREPARARAGQELHWQYIRHDIPALALGRNRRRRLTVPTLLLTGAADPVITPKLLPGGDRYASDLRVRTVPRAGHLLPEERPDLVASALRELTQATSAAERPAAAAP
jgi:pimeloyl-ACP methyl ester carboxylesterase